MPIGQQGGGVWQQAVPIEVLAAGLCVAHLLSVIVLDPRATWRGGVQR